MSRSSRKCSWIIQNLAKPPLMRICRGFENWRDLRALSGKFLRQKSCYPDSFHFLWLSESLPRFLNLLLFFTIKCNWIVTCIWTPVCVPRPAVWIIAMETPHLKKDDVDKKSFCLGSSNHLKFQRSAFFISLAFLFVIWHFTSIFTIYLHLKCHFLARQILTVLLHSVLEPQ